MELEQTGLLYVTVNGVRTVDMVKSKQAGLGCAVRTPLNFSPIKEDMLHSYVADLVVRSKELVISVLTPSTSMYDLNDRVTGSGNKSATEKVADIKTQVADLICRDAGLVSADLGSFSTLLETYSDPLALEAIKRGKLSERGVAEKMASHIVTEVVDQLRADNKEVEAFYQAQQLTKGGVKDHIGSIFSTDSTVGQTAARLNKILAAYPTSAKLYRTVVSNALDANEALCASIAGTVRNAIPPNQRLRLADQFEAIGNHQHGGKEHTGEYSYDHGHHAGDHHGRHHHKDGAKEHRPHGHGPDGHHLGGHREYHHGMMHEDEAEYGYPHARHHYPEHHHMRRHAEYAQAAYPRHEAHLTAEEATQAQIRSYVASGFVPPRFEAFAVAEAKTAAKTVSTQPARSAVASRVAVASKSTPNVTREAPSLEPPRTGVLPASATLASAVRIRPVANSFPVAVGSAVLLADTTTTKKQAAFSRSPPPLEQATRTSSPASVAQGLQSVELPSTGPIAVQDRRAGSSPSVAVASSLWTNEMPSAEVVSPISRVAVAVSPKTAAAPIRSRPPPIEYVKKSSPSPVTPLAPKEQSSLPSLAQMLKTAAESGRVH
jgi:hypothetical protein